MQVHIEYASRSPRIDRFDQGNGGLQTRGQQPHCGGRQSLRPQHHIRTDRHAAIQRSWPPGFGGCAWSGHTPMAWRHCCQLLVSGRRWLPLADPARGQLGGPLCHPPGTRGAEASRYIHTMELLVWRCLSICRCDADWPNLGAQCSDNAGRRDARSDRCSAGKRCTSRDD